ncbi:MAG: RNA methyltransferase [Deltaproteobacteria bacterium]|nr:RNA methyltransferase [Deltaproteobacteria bacterium]
MNFMPLSKNHQKWIRRLHQKKYRQEEKAFIAEGRNALEAATRMNLHSVKEIVIDKNHEGFIEKYFSHHRISYNESIYTCSKKEMESISTEETPQGVLLICDRTELSFEKLEEKSDTTLVYMEKISDPGNLGTIMRTAAWFGIKQIILGPLCVDPFNTKVVRSTAGAIFSMEIYCSVNPERLFQFAQKKRYTMIAAIPEGGTPINLWRKKRKNIIMLGHETDGLSGEIIEKADQRISIPGHGSVESLNMAIAAAIILHEIAGK